jgi:succinate dehydrogenase/fumarate reductase flavoprotein subunit
MIHTMFAQEVIMVHALDQTNVNVHKATIQEHHVAYHYVLERTQVIQHHVHLQVQDNVLLQTRANVILVI